MSNDQITTEHLHLLQWQDRLQEAIDQALSPTATVQLHAHLASCAICTKEHQRLLAVDAQLRQEFAVTLAPSPGFDQRLLANIALLEQDKRAVARQREQHEYATRVARLRGAWRELMRFHLGNIIGVAATLGASAAAIGSMWPTLWSSLNQRLAQIAIALPQGLGLSSLSIAIVVASMGVAAAAMWYIKTSDRPVS